MSRPLRVGVIGTGVMGTDHAALLHGSVSGAVLTRVTDADLARAVTVAESLTGVTVAADAAELIAADEVDAVLIASSDATHAELVVAATRAGKPVLCEKPLAPTLAESAEVVATLERDGTLGLLSLGFMRRFDPGYTDLKAALDARACGEPLLLHCVSRNVAAHEATTRYSVTGSAVHEFDTVPWLLGSPVVEVSWLAPRSTREVPQMQDPQVTLLRTADGVLTTMEIFLNAGYGYDIRCEVVCETGALSLTEPARLVTDTARARSTGYAADWRPRFADAYRLELQAWVDAVRAGTPPPLATALDGLAADTVSDAVLRSMAAGGAWTAVEPVRSPAAAPPGP